MFWAKVCPNSDSTEKNNSFHNSIYNQSHFPLYTLYQLLLLSPNFRSSSTTLLEQNFWGQLALSLGRKPEIARGGVMPCFLFHYPKKTNLHEWMKLSKGIEFNKCISTVATGQSTPLQILFYSLLRLAEFVFANYMLTDPRLQQHDWLKQI